MEMKTVNQRMKDLREDNDLTQQKIANMLKVSQNTYSDYEHAKLRVPFDVIVALAKFYDVSLDYLSGCSNVKNPFPKQ